MLVSVRLVGGCWLKICAGVKMCHLRGLYGRAVGLFVEGPESEVKCGRKLERKEKYATG